MLLPVWKKIYFYIYAGPDRRNCRSAGHWGEWLGSVVSVVCWRGEVCSQMKAQGTAGHFWIFNGCRFGHAVSSCWRTRNYDNHFLGTDAEWSIWRSLHDSQWKLTKGVYRKIPFYCGRSQFFSKFTSDNSNINSANYKWNIKHDPSAYNHNPGSKILTELNRQIPSLLFNSLSRVHTHTHWKKNCIHAYEFLCVSSSSLFRRSI